MRTADESHDVWKSNIGNQTSLDIVEFTMTQPASLYIHLCEDVIIPGYNMLVITVTIDIYSNID